MGRINTIKKTICIKYTVLSVLIIFLKESINKNNDKIIIVTS